jgi:energy-coupling factor transporter ATP-binding protein EcfA2
VDEISIDFDNITTLIGKNDSGKSTIMDALDIFLNDIDPDKDDGSKNGNPKDLAIICEFTNLPDELILDDTNPTNLSDEYLLNERGNLEIHKIYDGHLQSPKISSIEACAYHPTIDGVKDLLQLKNAELKARAMELHIDLSGIDSRANAPIRKCIREHFDDLRLSSIMIPLNEDNAKKIWAELLKYLPVFALFKSDRASTDQDPEAQDPLKTAVQEAIKAKEAELNAIADYIKNEVKKIADSTLEKLKEMDPKLATQLNPSFSTLKWHSLFKTSITGDEGIPINKRGSGVKRLILLNFFRAKAEEKVKTSNQESVIYAIEEPETSQHPNYQIMLFRALNDLSIEAQVIISTHTPMLARGVPDCELRYIQINEDNTRTILNGCDHTNKIFTKALGVLPDNNVKLFIGIEGCHDISFLRGISKALIEDGIDVPDIEKLEVNGEIIFFPLGGSNLVLWTSRLKHLNRPEFHLYDRDTTPPADPHYKQEIDDINNRENCFACSTLKKEMENYIHKDAIIQAYHDIGINIQIPQNFNDFDDVPLEIAKLVHNSSESQNTWIQLSPKKQKEKINRSKRMLNLVAVKKMNHRLLNEIDPAEDVFSWLTKIQQLFNQDNET